MGIGRNKYNCAPYRETGSFTIADVTDTSYQTSWINTQGMTYGSFQFEWSGLDAFNARAIMQGSIDDDDDKAYNDLGGESGGIILLNDAAGSDNQLWSFTSFPDKFIRLDFTKNSLTSGSFSWIFEGF